eukprot:gene19752-25684_t
MSYTIQCLSLTQAYAQGFPVVKISNILDSNLTVNNPLLRVGGLVIKVNNISCEGLNIKQVSEVIKSTPRPITIKFRDPSRFFEQLESTSYPLLKTITTQYLPKNTKYAGAPEQVIKVERLSIPPREERLRGSQPSDVLEIQYVGQILGKSDIVESSAEKAPPGTSTKSIYYILGSQNGPPGKFPIGWDLTLRGMVVGEKRRITLPFSLAYDKAGVKDKNIPPFATMVYTVKLVSLT